MISISQLAVQATYQSCSICQVVRRKFCDVVDVHETRSPEVGRSIAEADRRWTLEQMSDNLGKQSVVAMSRQGGELHVLIRRACS